VLGGLENYQRGDGCGNDVRASAAAEHDVSTNINTSQEMDFLQTSRPMRSVIIEKDLSLPWFL
jgi:hypothetical protein